MKKVLVLSFLSASLFLACNKNDNNTNTPEPTPIVIPEGTVNVKTFDNVKVAFAEGYSQSAEGTFNFPTEVEHIRSIKMYLKDICPNHDCDEWDRYANIYAKDKTTGEWYEIARFITPYWVGNELLDRGYEFDVTDFKSLLNGQTDLKIYTETWLPKGRTYSLEFDVEYGEPDYKYSAVVPVMQYNQSSQHGVPYGKAHSFDLTRNITIPSSAEQAYFRTIITGWGHSVPGYCAEWCFRTHHIHLDGNQSYEHKLEALGCADNPINNQSPGNWMPNRAGWCPGMVVPERFDLIDPSRFGTAFDFEYKFAPYTTTGDAFYAISTFVVVKSNQPIEKATVIND
ncbi:MAG: peptide-N-glycosidase F-related protein [Bacteroidota bacterium]|nr:peptide-N-glycosidase F-related protein [Bacteroidota bacterium]